jgi:hypothetical protein
VKTRYLAWFLAASLVFGAAVSERAEAGFEAGEQARAVLAQAAPKGQSGNKGSDIKLNEKASKEQYPASAIKIGAGKIQPGDDLQIVFGVADPPDEILPMRSKNKDANSDYIHFIYRNRFTININKQNMVQSIVVFGNGVDMVGVPFKIGQSTSDVLNKWKDPERETSGMLIYFYRGVYIITDKKAPDKIDKIYMTLPGKLEDDDSKDKQKDKQS